MNLACSCKVLKTWSKLWQTLSLHISKFIILIRTQNNNFAHPFIHGWPGPVRKWKLTGENLVSVRIHLEVCFKLGKELMTGWLSNLATNLFFKAYSSYYSPGWKLCRHCLLTLMELQAKDAGKPSSPVQIVSFLQVWMVLRVLPSSTLFLIPPCVFQFCFS